MSELKCPFCQQDLGGNMAEPCCRNQNCEMNAIPIPRTIWEKLTQAKQDLETARDAITDVFSYVKEHEKDIGGCAVNIVIKLGIALTQIEHKDE